MPDDMEQLEKKIAEGLEAVRELRKLKAQQQRKDRPKLKLLKGGLVGAGIWAGVEWFLGYKRIAVALVAAGITVSGAVIAEHPGSPGADPPQAIKPPASIRPTVEPPSPPPRPKATPTPRRTSPPRTQAPMRIPPPTAEPTTARPTVKPKERPTVTPSRTTTMPPKPTVSSPVTSTVTSSVPADVVTPTTCTIDLLGVELCLPLG